MGGVGDVVSDIADKALGPIDDAIKAGGKAIGELAQGDFGGAAKALGKGLVDAGTDFLPPGISNVAKQFGNKFIDSIGGGGKGAPEPKTPNLGGGPTGPGHFPSAQPPGAGGVSGCGGMQPREIASCCTRGIMQGTDGAQGANQAGGTPDAIAQLQDMADEVQGSNDMFGRLTGQFQDSMQDFQQAADLMEQRGLISEQASNRILNSHL